MDVDERTPLSPGPSVNPSLLPSYSTAQVPMALRPVPRKTLIRARVLGTVAFLFHFGCALFAVLAPEGWRTVTRANKYAFTPNTYMALAFWGVQTLVQLYWVRNLFIYDATEIGALEALPYAPLYAAGTVCLGIYTLLFVHKHFLVALAFILVGTLTQLTALARLPVINTHDNLATQLCAKSGAALSVLHAFHSVGVAFGVRAPPNTLVQALAGTAFGLAALVTDPVFGAGMVYDVLALVLAQRRLWASELTYLALACGAVVLVKFAVFRVY